MVEIPTGIEGDPHRLLLWYRSARASYGTLCVIHLHRLLKTGLTHLGTDYIVQGSRFQIVEGFGCMGDIYPCGVAFMLLHVWPLFFAIASTSLYSCMS